MSFEIFESSTIKSIDWIKGARSGQSPNVGPATESEVVGLLRVEFQNGRAYEYFDVPYETAKGLIVAESAGRAFSKDIRGHYHYQEVNPPSKTIYGIWYAGPDFDCSWWVDDEFFKCREDAQKRVDDLGSLEDYWSVKEIVLK